MQRSGTTESMSQDQDCVMRDKEVNNNGKNKPIPAKCDREALALSQESNKEIIQNDVQDILESDLKCAICQDIYINPLILNCSHSFCKFCVYKWLSKRPGCPQCRMDVSFQAENLALRNLITRMVQKSSQQFQIGRTLSVNQRLKDEEAQEKEGTTTMVRKNYLDNARRPLYSQFSRHGDIDYDYDDSDDESDSGDSDLFEGHLPPGTLYTTNRSSFGSPPDVDSDEDDDENDVTFDVDSDEENPSSESESEYADDEYAEDESFADLDLTGESDSSSEDDISGDVSIAIHSEESSDESETTEIEPLPEAEDDDGTSSDDSSYVPYLSDRYSNESTIEYGTSDESDASYSNINFVFSRPEDRENESEIDDWLEIFVTLDY